MPQLRLLALPIALVLASAAAANLITVSHDRLSVGTSFDVIGSDFRKNPSLWLEFEGRKIPLKVLKGGTDTQLTAKLTGIPRGAHGDCQLRMRPRGVQVPFTLAGITIEVPDVDTVTPLAGGAGTQVTIDGAFFGARKGRVDFGERHGKIVTWTDTQIRAIVPKGLTPGEVIVRVTSKAGTSIDIVKMTVQ